MYKAKLQVVMTVELKKSAVRLDVLMRAVLLLVGVVVVYVTKLNSNEERKKGSLAAHTCSGTFVQIFLLNYEN